ncbi:MAG: DUF3971 domain-containing protein [Gammaproteobacteria bacterium]|nr:DUF3971 domain-containing protein [Gammaproteobacteria bacterium]
MKWTLASFAATATVVAVLLALTQLAGRAAVSLLPAFEPELNGWLEDVGAEVHGIEGRWHGINPGFAVRHIRFASGELHDVRFELDILESLWRNRVVARHLAVADGTVDFERHGLGWRLRGVTQPLDFDFATLAAYSDAVKVTLRLRMFEAGHVQELGRLAWLGSNYNNRHLLSLTLTPPGACDSCGLLLEGEVRSGGDGHGRLIASRLATEAMSLAGDAEINAIGTWRRDEGSGQARLRLDVSDAKTPGGALDLTAQLSAWSVSGGEGEHRRGRIDQMRVTIGNQSLALGGGFAIDGDGIDIWSPELNLAELARMGALILGPHAAAAWLRGPAPTGRLRAVRARLATDGNVAWMAQAEDLSLAGYRGAPAVAGADGRLVGVVEEGAARVAVRARDGLEIGFTDHFAGSWRLQRAVGELTFWVRGGHLHLRGSGIEAATADVQARGGFALAHDGSEGETRVLIEGVIDRADVASAFSYIPRKLPAATRSWLRSAVGGGVLHNGRLLWHSRARPVHGLLSRRFELRAGVQDATVAYDPEWPEARDFDGRVTITPGGVVVQGDATVFGARLKSADVRVPASGDLVRVRFAAEHDADELLAFLRAMPERHRPDFLHDEWSATGNVAVMASLAIPLGEPVPGSSPIEQALDIELDLMGTDVNLGSLGLAFDDMVGHVSLRLPDVARADGLAGELFGKPVTMVVASETEGDGGDHAIRFDVRGAATVRDAAALLEVEPPPVVVGEFGFDATFTAFPEAGRAPELTVRSDLKGVALDLPAPLGKSAETARELHLTAQLLDGYRAVNLRYANDPAASEAAGEAASTATAGGHDLALSGWLHVVDDGLLRGALGIGAPAPIADATADRVILQGSLGAVPFAAEAIAALPDWEARELRLARLDLGQFALDDVVVSGQTIGSESTFTLRSDEAEGTFARTGNAPWQVNLASIRLPAGEEEDESDPLTVAVMDDLPDADVNIQSVHVGEDDYGSWRFNLRSSAEGVSLVDLSAEVRGLEVEVTEPLHWSRASNTTEFVGVVGAGNVAEVLPQWDFAPSVESESFAMQGRLSWPGSPLMFNLAHLSGDARLDLDSGRFVDVDTGSGATRIMSLVNFWTIAKRLNLDFSDVFGEGIGFDEVRMQLALDDGLAHFEEPASIAGTGSSFRINGTVDLDTGELDNEMIVTLPLHQSLPWYAAFIALANPAGAVGVLVGGQLLREPLSRLTSGKYRIGGTYDEPEVDFVSIFAEDIEGTAAPEATEEPMSAPVDAALMETSAR